MVGQLQVMARIGFAEIISGFVVIRVQPPGDKADHILGQPNGKKIRAVAAALPTQFLGCGYFRTSLVAVRRPRAPLLISQSYDWTDTHGPTSRYVAGEQCHTTEEQCDTGEGERISAGNFEEQAFHYTRYRNRSDET